MPKGKSRRNGVSVTKVDVGGGQRLVDRGRRRTSRVGSPKVPGRTTSTEITMNVERGTTTVSNRDNKKQVHGPYTYV